MIASALSGCASLAMEKALGPNPQLYPPVVEAYEWAGRRGDELVVVYRVWGGHPRRHETRWTALDLQTAGWAPGLGAPRVGDLGDQPEVMPAREATDLVPVVPLFGPLKPEVVNARDDHRPAGRAAVALYARGGSVPELIVVTRDGAGELRSASWALRPTEDPGRAESAPRQLARGAAGRWTWGRRRSSGCFCCCGWCGSTDALAPRDDARPRSDAAVVPAGGGVAAGDRDGVFLPHPGWQCGECPFRSRCWVWDSA